MKGHGALNQLIAYGIISPGDDRPGKLTFTGLLDLDLNSTFAVKIAGTNAGVDCDQLVGMGFLNFFGPCTLKLAMLPGFAGSIGYQYTIVRNLGGNPVAGTFAGLPEGATAYSDIGASFKISYLGGGGNDVVLTQTGLPTPPNLTGITHLSTGNVTITGTSVPNMTYHVQATTSLAPPNWVTLGAATANNLGALIFTDSEAGLYPSRLYRFMYP